jgi:hypothetical protein
MCLSIKLAFLRGNTTNKYIPWLTATLSKKSRHGDFGYMPVIGVDAALLPPDSSFYSQISSIPFYPPSDFLVGSPLFFNFPTLKETLASLSSAVDAVFVRRFRHGVPLPPSIDSLFSLLSQSVVSCSEASCLSSFFFWFLCVFPFHESP